MQRASEVGRGSDHLLPFAAAVIVIVTIAGMGVAYLLVGAGQIASASLAEPGVTVADLPPAGHIWFGADFDGRAFTITGRADSVRTGSTVAAVARLSSPVREGHARIETGLDGNPIASHEVTVDDSAPQDVIGWTFAMPVAGAYRVTVLDPSGTLLAEGAVTAR